MAFIKVKDMDGREILLRSDHIVKVLLMYNEQPDNRKCVIITRVGPSVHCATSFDDVERMLDRTDGVRSGESMLAEGRARGQRSGGTLMSHAFICLATADKGDVYVNTRDIESYRAPNALDRVDERCKALVTVTYGSLMNVTYSPEKITALLKEAGVSVAL